MIMAFSDRTPTRMAGDFSADRHSAGEHHTGVTGGIAGLQQKTEFGSKGVGMSWLFDSWVGVHTRCD